MKNKLKITLSDGKKIKKSKVDRPDFTSLNTDLSEDVKINFAERNPRLIPSERSTAILAIWLETAKTAFPEISEWAVDYTKSHVVEDHVYLQLSKPGFNIPVFEFDAELGEMIARTPKPELKSIYIKNKG